MKRKWISFLALVLILACCVLPAMAASPRLTDEADLLSDEERTQIENQLNSISGSYGVDVVIVTTDSVGGSTPMEYADDYYDYHDYAPDGVLLLVSMEDSDWWISTTGYGITAFTDAGIAYIGDQVVPYLSDGEYAEAFTVFANQCDTFLAQAKAGDPFDTHNLPKEPFRFVRNLVICVVLGLVVALLVTGKMKNELKSVCQKAGAEDYVAPGSLQLTRSRDFHLYTQLHRTEKAQSSGGSSTHTSSSGTTHGGGGGKF